MKQDCKMSFANILSRQTSQASITSLNDLRFQYRLYLPHG